MLGVLSHHSSANPGWRYQFLFLSHILSMLATCIQFFPLQGTGTPLIFQKQEQRVEILHLKIVRTLCCSISSYARRSYPHHVWLQIWALKASRSFTTHTHSTWMRDIFPAKCTKSSSCNPFNWPSWISWWRCSWYTGVSAVFSLWSPFFRLFSTEGFRILGAILQSPVVWHHAYASVQPKLVTKHISTTCSVRIWVTQNKWICTDVN